MGLARKYSLYANGIVRPTLADSWYLYGISCAHIVGRPALKDLDLDDLILRSRAIVGVFMQLWGFMRTMEFQES